MNAEILKYSTPIPADVDPEQWLRSVKGSRYLDDLWCSGQRCPANREPDKIKCKCFAESNYCSAARKVEEIAAALGGATAKMWQGLA
jgi:hypothetical protein